MRLDPHLNAACALSILCLQGSADSPARQFQTCEDVRDSIERGDLASALSLMQEANPGVLKVCAHVRLGACIVLQFWQNMATGS